MTAVTTQQNQTKEPPKINSDELWEKILSIVPARGSLRSLADTIRPIGTDGKQFFLGYSPDDYKKVDSLASASNRRQLEMLLSQTSGREWSVRLFVVV